MMSFVLLLFSAWTLVAQGPEALSASDDGGRSVLERSSFGEGVFETTPGEFDLVEPVGGQPFFAFARVVMVPLDILSEKFWDELSLAEIWSGGGSYQVVGEVVVLDSEMGHHELWLEIEPGPGGVSLGGFGNVFDGEQISRRFVLAGLVELAPGSGNLVLNPEHRFFVTSGSDIE